MFGLAPHRAGLRARLWHPPLLLLLASSAAASVSVSSTSITLELTGQALIQSDICQTSPAKVQALAEVLHGHDVVFTDLETAIATSAAAKTRDTQFFHAAPPEVLDCLKTLGFNLLALSNNHSFDLGPSGVLAAVEETRRRGFVVAGTGPNLAAAAAPAVLITPHGRVALVSMASGKVGEGAMALADRAGVNEVRLDEKSGEINLEDATRVFESLRAAAASADVVIAYQHDHYWEKDNRVTPEWKRHFAHACIDAGATLFVSHGAPLLHGIEIYRGRAIFYDLGGLIFHTITAPGYYLPEVWQSVLANVDVSQGRVTSVRLRAVSLNEKGEGEPPSPQFYATRGTPSLASGETARAIFQRLAVLSKKYGTTMEIEGDEARINLPIPTLNSSP